MTIFTKILNMKLIISISFAIFLCLGCTDTNSSSEKIKNEVIVLGTVHSHHLTEPSFGLNVLKDLIEKIDPDFILAEIPPDRFDIAQKQFNTNGVITEARVKRFPEYVNVIFPLTKSMKFEIIPTAAWTKAMADARSAKIKEIEKDATRKVEWDAFKKAGERSDSLLKASGRQYDPFWINSIAYDEAVEVELSVYNQFNEELGPGGWDNINEAHFAYISKALDKYKNQGKRFLITYGAGHKGWFLKALSKRDDVEILGLREAIGEVE